MQSLTRGSDTICALSTPPGVAALAVVRVSGRDAVKVCRQILKFLPTDPQSHRAYYGYASVVNDGADAIDEVVALYFAEGKSFTGEESIEISTHGSPAVVNTILQQLISAGARLAEKGEFTYRAFRNGRIDLVQAESILAIIHSHTEATSRTALRQLRGELSSTLKEIEENLIWLISRLEANIDFSQEDIEFESENALIQKSVEVVANMRKLLSTYRMGSVLRQGLRIAFVGATNAGKSSLFNQLVGFDRAIVSPVDGTTRDLIEAEVTLSGHKVVFMDTAGLRDTEDYVEQQGINRTHTAIKDADAIIYVRDSSCRDEGPTVEDLSFGARPVIHVQNKIDLLTSDKFLEQNDSVCRVSATTGYGIETLRARIVELLPQRSVFESPVLLQTRHYELLKKAEFHASVASTYLREGTSPDIVVSEFSEALRGIFEIFGKALDEEVIDRIFSDFCLGK